MSYLLIIYVPIDHAQAVKQAIFDAGAGQIGNYKHCCWTVVGQGQFMPCQGANPYVGKLDKLQEQAELRIECYCASEVVGPVVQALKAAHPYETPAFSLLPCHDITEVVT